jgi:hypothetical protein
MDALPFIQYRTTRAAANASAQELANLDAHIANILAAKPPCLVPLTVQQMGKAPTSVSIDLNMHTVADLGDRIGATLGYSPGRLRLIYKGRHMDSPGSLCRDVGIHSGAVVGVCLKLGCPGYGCCDASYNMLGDALLRQATSLASSGILSSLSQPELDKVFTAVSKLEAAKPSPTPKPEAAVMEPAKVIWAMDSSTTGKRSLWAEPSATAKLSLNSKDLMAALAAISTGAPGADCNSLLANPEAIAQPDNDLCGAVISRIKPSARTPSVTSLANQDLTSTALPQSDSETDLYG